jgi:hypothetical protein
MREGSARRNDESTAREGVRAMALDTFTLIASQYALEEDALEDTTPFGLLTRTSASSTRTTRPW